MHPTSRCAPLGGIPADGDPERGIDDAADTSECREQFAEDLHTLQGGSTPRSRRPLVARGPQPGPQSIPDRSTPAQKPETLDVAPWQGTHTRDSRRLLRVDGERRSEHGE